MKSSESLQRYWKKRNFIRTTEPRGRGRRASSSGPSLHYVVQKHAARRLHYDFRLELDGTLKSWAVPKGPSLNPSDKRLAVHVEDHPMEYADFEGIIPHGQYGAGTVMVWDRGEWIPDGDPKAAYDKGHLTFTLAGQKLQGRWALVRMGGARNRDGTNWLLIKGRDRKARAGASGATTQALSKSVKSGMAMNEIAAARTAEWYSGQATPQATPDRTSRRTSPSSSAAVRNPRREVGGTPGKLPPCPKWVQPQLATLVEDIPEGEEWVHEVKYDGYRLLCRIDQGAAKLFSRNGRNWTAKLNEHASAAAKLKVINAWLDGELVALGEDGTMSFQALQNAFGGTGNSQLVYFVFDLLFLDGLDLRAMPLHERKRRLTPLLTGSGCALRYSNHVPGQGRTVFETACRRGLEGLVAKLADGRYVAGRNKNWVKVKCHHRQEFVIGGFTDPAGSRRGLGALLLGVYENQQGRRRFVYVGRVGTGFSEARLSHLHRVLRKLERSRSPFINPPTGRDAHGVHSVTPKLVAEIQFAEWTQEGLLRHASFLGLRDDKPARTIVREIPSHHPTGMTNPNTVTAMPDGRQPSNSSRMGGAGTSRSKTSISTAVAGVKITHPHRALYADHGITKLDVAQYYESMAEWILPHLKGRPLTIVRCPEGQTRGCFYQKHVTDQIHEAIDRVEVEETQGRACYMVANTTAAIVALAQLGMLELHTWGATQNRLDRPDRMILDLDPAPDLAWEVVIEAAFLMRTLLDELSLKSFVKTTGGKGLHVVVPLRRNHSWEEVKEFSKALAEHMTQTIPARFTDNMSKRARKGKVYIDFLRNDQGATAVAAYSTRAKPGAPVSVPLAWDEVSPSLRSDQFTMRTVGERLSKLASDPWEDYFTEHQLLTSNMRRCIGIKSPPS